MKNRFLRTAASAGCGRFALPRWRHLPSSRHFCLPGHPQRRGQLCPGANKHRCCYVRQHLCRGDNCADSPKAVDHADLAPHNGNYNSGDGCCDRFAPDHREVTVTAPEGYSSMQTARLPE